jgi:cyclopropane-fatty-acyl-phospholipid synthase
MNDSVSHSASLDATPIGTSDLSLRSRFILRLLERLKTGELEVVLPDGSTRLYRGSDTLTTPCIAAHRARIDIHDIDTLSMAVSRGDIGFGEAYMQGMWSSPNLTALLRVLAANRDAVEKVIYGRWWSTAVDQLRHLLRSNRKRQAKRNISAHYDLGNDFYRRWLDPSMSYSSALFDTTGCWSREVDLQAGQLRKIDRAISELGIDPADSGASVLEIGCGWGGLAERLLENNACRYRGLTLSTEQKLWADRLLEKNATRAAIALQDYRDETGRFDGIVSIEMFEAVGERYWDDYFETLRRCLKPGGRALIQTITIDPRLFERYRRSTDFIQQYIFPGGMLPSPQAFIQCAQKHGLVTERQLFFGHDYARTLAEWARRFEIQRSDIEHMGFDARFQRMWRFYLAYCEAGFSEGNIDVGQFTLRAA